MAEDRPTKYPKRPEGFGVVAEATRRSMSANRSKNTALETGFRKALREAGMSGYRVHPSSLPGKPDVAWIGRKVAVFLHGCFWHACPHCGRYRLPKHNSDYWQAKVEANRTRHELVESQLRGLGYRVVVLWECHVNSEPTACVARVREALELHSTE